MTAPNSRRVLSGRRLQLGDTTAAPAELQAALQALQDAPGQLQQVIEDHRNELADLRRTAASDPNLSDAGREAAIAGAGQRLVSASTAAVDAIRRRTDAATATLDRAAAAATPPPQPGVEALMARQVAWGRTRSLLDSGIPADQLIAEATDPEQLAMLAEELPTWLRVQGAGADVALVVQYAIAMRYADLAATPAQAAAVRIDLAAMPYEAALSPLLDAAPAVTGTWQIRGTDLTAAIRSNQMFQAAQRALTGGYDGLDDESDARARAAASRAYGSNR